MPPEVNGRCCVVRPIEIEHDKEYTTSTFTLWNTHPQWPNALAAGVLIYLAIYTIKKRERHATIPPEV